MPAYLFQVTIPTKAGVSADIHMNNFVVSSPSVVTPGDPSAQGICDLMATNFDSFYGEMSGAGAMRGYDISNGTVKFLQWPGTKPNYPLAESSMPPGRGATDFDMPAEVALCISYANDSEVGLPRAQRRGRIYIGGWSTNAVGVDGRPTSTAVSFALNGATQLLADIASDFGEWAIYSSRSLSTHLIERLWVDDEWDTQRRRGRKATTRSTQLIPSS